MNLRHRFFIFGMIVMAFGCLSVSLRATPNGKYRGAELITTAQLKDYLTFIAADELEGRDSPSHEIAAKVGITMIGRAVNRRYLLFTGAERFVRNAAPAGD